MHVNMICPLCKKSIPEKDTNFFLASRAGQVRSKIKSLAARENGKKGGRPRKFKEEREEG